MEGTGFEPSVPPRKRRSSREAPRPTIAVSRDDLVLNDPIQLIGPASLVGNSREPAERGEPLGRVVRYLIGPSSAHWEFALQVIWADVDGQDASVPTAGSHPS